MRHDFPDEDIFSLTNEMEQERSWTLWFDGASNVLGYARLGFSCINNMAKYEACTVGISMALEYQVKSLKVYGDSALETRDTKLIPYYPYIKELAECFESITFHHTPWEDNQMADALATLASMFKMDRESEVSVPTYCQALEEEVDGKPWYHDIKEYLKYKEYPPGITENNKRMLRRTAGSYLLNKGVLYKRSPNMMLLQCVDDKEAKEILEEIHEGIFGTHLSGPNMARKIPRARYYWAKMESDYCKHVRTPPDPLIVLSTPWPFAMWGIDVIGPIDIVKREGERKRERRKNWILLGEINERREKKHDKG
ncbi:hypothetical protein CR513_30714, partial [Mucuna pruriens]